MIPSALHHCQPDLNRTWHARCLLVYPVDAFLAAQTSRNGSVASPVNLRICLTETTRNDAVEPSTVFMHDIQSNLRCLPFRVALHTGADVGECDALRTALGRPVERILITTSERLRLALTTACPDRTNGVHHPAGWQIEALGGTGFTGRATTDGSAHRHQLRPSGAVNRAVFAPHPTVSCWRH